MATSWGFDSPSPAPEHKSIALTCSSQILVEANLQCKSIRLAVVIGTLSAVLQPAAAADMGVAVFIAGPCNVVDAAGNSRVLSKGTQVACGDLIRTAGDARVQLQFPDGAFVSLLPGTELKVEAYRFVGAARGRQTALFTLLRGTARFQTGAIGRAAGSRFRTTTTLAALDVQSAEFVAAITKELQISVGNGAVNVSNDGGTLTVNAGQRALVGDRSAVPYLIGTAIPERLVP